MKFMRITDVLKEHSQGPSFEFFPPKTDAGKKSLQDTIKALRGYKPLYASMTCGAGGKTQDRTKEAVYMLLDQKELVVMPHMTCIDIRRDAVEKLLDEYRERDVENIMVLRGDPPLGFDDFDFSGQDFRYARDLVLSIKKYGHF